MDVAVHVEAEREAARSHPPVDAAEVRWEGDELHGSEHCWTDRTNERSAACLLPSCGATGRDYLRCGICRGRLHVEHWRDERERASLHSVPCRPSFVDAARPDAVQQAKKHFWSVVAPSADSSDSSFDRRCAICRRKGRASSLVHCLHCRRSVHRTCFQAKNDEDELCDFGAFG